MEEKMKIIEGDQNQSVDDFYVNFKQKLEEEHKFPCNYMFKFIVPADEEKIALLEAIFDKSNATISNRESKNGKYTSMTIIVNVHDANDVIIYYRQVAKIEGVVML